MHKHDAGTQPGTGRCAPGRCGPSKPALRKADPRCWFTNGRATAHPWPFALGGLWRSRSPTPDIGIKKPKPTMGGEKALDGWPVDALP